MSEEKGYSTLGWFVAGVSIGAVIGILFAPKSGRETREDLVNGAREGSEFLRTKAHDAAEKFGDVVDRSKTQVADLYDRGKDQWDDLVEKSRDYVSDKASRVTAAMDAGRQAYYTSTRSDSDPKL